MAKCDEYACVRVCERECLRVHIGFDLLLPVFFFWSFQIGAPSSIINAETVQEWCENHANHLKPSEVANDKRRRKKNTLYSQNEMSMKEIYYSQLCTNDNTMPIST